MLDDLRNEITTLEQEKSVLENELNELRAKINSMTDLTVTENGTYTPEFGYKKVTVNVPQTGVSEMQSLEVLETGEYINQTIPYSSVTVSDTVFYKKYIDGEGNTYIINENGEIIITYSGETPPTPTDEYAYLYIYIPNDNNYDELALNGYASAFSEVYFDEIQVPYNSFSQSYILKQPITPNTYHTVKAKMLNNDNISVLSSLSSIVLYINGQFSPSQVDLLKVVFAMVQQLLHK